MAHERVLVGVETSDVEHAAGDGAGRVCERVANLLFDVLPGVLYGLAARPPGNRVRGEACMEERQGEPV